MSHWHLLMSCACSALVPSPLSCAATRPKSAEAWRCLTRVKQHPSAQKDKAYTRVHVTPLTASPKFHS